jgi:flagellar basal body rod protein FlgC
MSTIGPALSGMIAATVRLNASAQNTANAQTPGYQPKQVVQTATPSGVVATAKTPQRPGYFFIDPFAPGGPDESVTPGVDEGVEAVNQMQALNQFKANLQSVLSGDNMFKSALKIV